MSSQMNGAHAVVGALQQEGVKYVFGLPGTTIMNIIDALAQQKEIRYISTRHEQVAAFMADGYARGSGEIGVCLASRGPGAANMTIGVHNSYAESIPVLALLGQVADEIYYREAFEEMDLVKFYEPITKWSMEIHDARRIPELLQRAVRTAMGGRKRPVMVSVPLDAQLKTLEAPSFQPRFRHSLPVPPKKEIKEAVELLAEAKRPLVLLGGGAVTSKTYVQVAEFAEKLQMPVVTSWLRKDAFPNRHPLFFGTLGFGAPLITEELSAEADVILAVGCHFSEFTTKRWTLFSPETKLIHVEVDPEEIGKIYIPAIGLQGDAQATVNAMLELLAEVHVKQEMVAKRRAWLESIRPRYRQETTLPEPESASGQNSPGTVSSSAVIRTLEHVLERYPSLLVQDAPTFGVWIHRYLNFEQPGTLYSAAGGSMGWGLPASFGIQLARPDKRVITVAGDGAFWMVAQDLETAVRENIPVVTLVTNNFSYGNTRDRQRTAHDGRYLGVFYNNPDFAEFARLIGAYGERVERAEDLLPAVERALASGKPAVIDVIQDRFEGLPSGLTPPEAK